MKHYKLIHVRRLIMLVLCSIVFGICIGELEDITNFMELMHMITILLLSSVIILEIIIIRKQC